MVHKPIAIMILSIFVAGILMLGILAATANAQESKNTGNAEQQSNNTGNGQESNSTGNAQQQSNSTGNAQESSNTGNAQESSNATSPSGSTTNATLPSGSTPSNSTGNATADLATSILAVHNSARANVTVPPLVWNVTLAAGAKAWAEHLAATGKFEHSSGYMPRFEYGESIASRGQTTTVPLAQMQQGWIFEKNNYHGGPINETNAGLISHYTMMVWRTTTSIGCGTASGGGRDILVCRYSPGPTHGGGNTFGQKPY
ncbi:MAG: CAP domain-containing protein [Candidatus Nitrosopolaris sp.]